MTTPENKTSVATTRPSGYRWPREMADFVNSFWGDLDWPRRVLPGFDGSLKIEETLDDDMMTIRAEIPGVDPEKDVEISVDGDVLTISAKRESKTKETKNGSTHSEFRYGSFVRQLGMPKNADLDALTATYENGVIEVKIPMKAEAEPSSRKIAITKP